MRGPRPSVAASLAHRSERGGNWITACIEAVVAWNAPKPYHPAAVAFVNHSLDHWAGGVGKWHDRFTHRDSHHERAMGTGVVMDRHKKEKQRLPNSFYDVSAL